MIEISVIIPTYNPGPYLYECLDSVYNQSLSVNKWELIVVLNGNISEYKGIVEQEIFNCPKGLSVSFITTEVAGVSNARNLGLSKVRGNYICFIDDDDIISSYYLEKLLQKATPKTMVISNIYTFITDPKELRSNFFVCNQLKQKEMYNHASLFKNRSFLAFPVARIIHKDMVGRTRYDTRFKNGEDALFITSISNKIKDICFTDDDAIYYVRERLGSATRRKLSLCHLLKSTIMLLFAYISVYFTSPLTYNPLLFLSRLPGVIKGAYFLYKKNNTP